MGDMKTILLVDDDSEVLETLEETLKRAGYDIIPKPDAESALAVIREGVKIDLVITDQHLPGMKGTDLVAALKKAAPTLPVIMLTAYGSVESYIHSMTGGVFEYIHKPVQAEELRRIVKTSLDRPRDDHF
jgi:DNA-binding NtrC family response regulator